MSEDIFKFFEGPRKPFGRKPSRSNPNASTSSLNGEAGQSFEFDNFVHAQQKKRPLRKPKLNTEANGPVQNCIPETSTAIVQSIGDLIVDININEPEDIADFDCQDATQFEATTSQQDSEQKKKKKTRTRTRRKKKTAQEIQDENVEESVSVQEDVEDDESCSQQSDSKQRNDSSKYFPEYMSLEEVTKCLQGRVNDGNTYITGSLRINLHFHKHAFITMPDDDKGDLLIDGLLDRNRALEGDVVVAVVKPMNQWLKQSEGDLQKTGKVVHILEKVHSRKIVGYMHAKSGGFVLVPRDPRLPTFRILNNVPYPRKKSDDNSHQLYLGQLVSWKNVHCAFGRMIKSLGKSGDLKTETRAILLDHNLDVQPYPKTVLTGLPAVDFCPTVQDLAEREDWRQECIFTIDPATAVDLDDAVSCKLLPNGNYEIGVHISDVTHFLQAFSPLDELVAKRATTVYLTETVHHMLPKELCNVCSLLPGSDKLAFSVIWEMTPDAVPVKHRFAKTVINSCCQLSYDVAQNIIDKVTDECEINIQGSHDVATIIDTVTNLYNLSLKMRKRRFDGGALRIDQPKIYIQMDRVSGEPLSFMVEQLRDSNRLIEEFMLLANMTVAEHLFEQFPEFAMLRSHRDPSPRILQKTMAMLGKLGIDLDAQSAGALQTSINSCLLNGRVKEQTETELRMMAINTLCAKTMNRATYICSNQCETQDDLRHYALNVPFYTHFTSPIRRYADCIVHRLLNASLKNIPMDSRWNDGLCSTIAANCNVKKYCAKLAQEQSSELYFAYYLELKGPMRTTGVVAEIKRTYLDVILCEIGLKVRLLYIEIEKVAKVVNCYKNEIPLVRLIWDDTWQDVSILSILNLEINKHPENYQVQGRLLPPSK